MDWSTSSRVAAIGLLASTPAWACPVCGVGQGESESAFRLTTALLSAAPLVLIGGIAAYAWLRMRPADEGGAQSVRSPGVGEVGPGASASDEGRGPLSSGGSAARMT